MRAKQLERRDADLTETADMVKRMREQGKKWFDDRHETSDKGIKVDDMILLFDSQHEKDRSSKRKLNFK